MCLVCSVRGELSGSATLIVRLCKILGSVNTFPDALQRNRTPLKGQCTITRLGLGPLWSSFRMKRKERGRCTFDLCLFDSYSIAVCGGCGAPSGQFCIWSFSCAMTARRSSRQSLAPTISKFGAWKPDSASAIIRSHLRSASCRAPITTQVAYPSM